MLNPEEIQAMLKQKGVSQRELVLRSGLSESVVSTLIKQMPVLLPHLIDILGKNPYANDSVSQGEEMVEALESLSTLTRKRSISEPVTWQKDTRTERALPGRK